MASLTQTMIPCIAEKFTKIAASGMTHGVWRETIMDMFVRKVEVRYYHNSNYKDKENLKKGFISQF